MVQPPDPPPTGARGDDPPEPPALRRLRLMVSALILVLIAGVVVIAATIVIRLGGLGSIGEGAQDAAGLAAPVGADSLALPAGAEIRAIGRAGGEILIVTRGPDGTEALRAFDAATGAVRSVTAIRRE